MLTVQSTSLSRFITILPIPRKTGKFYLYKDINDGPGEHGSRHELDKIVLRWFKYIYSVYNIIWYNNYIYIYIHSFATVKFCGFFPSEKYICGSV